VTPVELGAFNRASSRVLGAVTLAVGAALLNAWGATVQSADDDALALWLARSVPLVGSGQRTAASSAARGTWALLARSDGITGLMPAFTPELVTAETAWQSSPVLRLRALLAEGQPWPSAKADSGAYAQMLSSGDIGAASRQGADHAAEVAAEQIAGPVAWAKVPAADCCPWCSRVSTRLYHRDRAHALSGPLRLSSGHEQYPQLRFVQQYPHHL
jgi:hypothetical protein